MDMQKQEMREAVELPLSHFDLYKQIGIDPPRSVLVTVLVLPSGFKTHSHTTTVNQCCGYGSVLDQDPHL